MRTTRNSGEIEANLAAASIVALGLILSCHYAIQTPVWQYPDEPAHYNYGFALASTGQLVEIKAGDWTCSRYRALGTGRPTPDRRQ